MESVPVTFQKSTLKSHGFTAGACDSLKHVFITQVCPSHFAFNQISLYLALLNISAVTTGGGCPAWAPVKKTNALEYKEFL